LVALRYLGTGCSFDVLKESSSIGEKMCCTFTHHFCSWFREQFRSMHIHLPATEAEITHVEELYGHLGLPGCIGSVDCVYIPWENVRQVYCQVAREKKIIQHWFSRLLFHIHVRFCPYLLFSLVLMMTKQLHDLILLSMKYIMEVIQKLNGSNRMYVICQQLS